MEVLRNWLLPALLAAAQVAMWPGVPLLRGTPVDRVEVAATLAATVLAAVALGWRRRAPVAVLAGVVPALTLAMVATSPESLLALVFADVITLYSIAVWRPVRVTLAATAVLSAWQAVLCVPLYGTGREYVGNLLIGVVVYLLAAGLGRSRRRWRAARQEAADRLARAEADRRQAATLERQRLARELHDVSAHHLTSIVVTVTAAQRLAERRPELAAEALEFAARTGRETLSALHRLVAVIGQSEPEPRRGTAARTVHSGAGLLGGPDLASRVEELAAGFAALGQPVSVRLPTEPIHGTATDAAYGIAREALTNALRHAPGAAVEVRLGQRDGALEVVIENGAATGPATVSGLGSGRGLAGMRERAASAGGTLEAGPLPGGGWRVRASLPGGAASAVDLSLRRVRGPRLTDVATALAVVAIPVAILLIPDATVPRMRASADALVALLLAGHALPLLWRRRKPWTALGAVLATTALWPLIVAFTLVPPVGLWVLSLGIAADLVAVYAVAAYGRPRHLTWLSVPLAAGTLGAITLITVALDGVVLNQPAGSAVTQFALIPVAAAFAVPVAVCWTAGFAIRLRRDRIVARERTAVAASTAGAVEMAYAERARIAAGLRAAVLRHAHRVTEAAGQGRLDGVLEAARGALAAMRDLLGDLRGDAERAPQPTAGAIDALCREQRAAGRAVELRSPAEPRALPPAVDVSAYRVVETALGAGDAGPARVTLGYGPDDLRITVTGVPSATAGPVAAGLRARINALGGRMAVDPTGTMDVWLPSRT